MTNYTRLGTSSNLETDGTYDILMFNFPKGYPNGAIELSFSNSPRVTTGVQKVAQCFAYCLLTSRGSDPIRPNFGTTFVEDALSSNISKDAGLMMSDIQISISEAERQTKALINNNSRRDRASQLESASIINLDSQLDGLTLSIRLVTRAGETAAVAIPFPQTNLEFN